MIITDDLGDAYESLKSNIANEFQSNMCKYCTIINRIRSKV